MQNLRQRALAAFVKINAEIDELKLVVGEWNGEIKGSQEDLSGPAKGGRPNREPGKYVKLALQIAATSKDGLVSVDDVVKAAPTAKGGRRPGAQNVKRALLDGESLGQLRSEGGRFGAPHKSD